MATIESLQRKYESLDKRISTRSEEEIDTGFLLAFDYEYPTQPSKVGIDTDEFTALCPWTGLPDNGTLTITYTPTDLCIELKSPQILPSFVSGRRHRAGARRQPYPQGPGLPVPASVDEGSPRLQGEGRPPYLGIGRAPDRSRERRRSDSGVEPWEASTR